MKKHIRYFCATVFAYFLIILGFPSRVKKKAKNGDFILSIYFHSPSKDLFEFCIRWLKKNSFQFLSEVDIVDLSKTKSFPKGGVVITVDDGWESNQENIVSIADKYKIPVTIFISSDPIEEGNFWWSYIKYHVDNDNKRVSIESLKRLPNKDRNKILSDIKNFITLSREAMTINQVKSISASNYITIGSHTVSHPILTNCSDAECYYELYESKKKLEQWTAEAINCFAYPNGDYSEREIKFLKEIGYRSAYTTNPSYLTKEDLNNIFRLPRFCIFEKISHAEAICRMVGIWQRIF